MARAKKQPAAAQPARAWARTAAGNVKATFTITEEQEKALRDEAFERARATGSARPDAGAVLREILEDWLKRRAR